MQKLKVLWFTNTPSLAELKVDRPYIEGGWIKSLEEAIREYTEDIELAVVFNSPVNDKYIIDGSTYYSVANIKMSKVEKLVKRKKAYETGDERQIQQYLSIIDEYKPDVIHIHGTEMNFGMISFRTDIPVAVSIQGLLTVYQNKFFGSIDFHSIHLSRRMRHEFSSTHKVYQKRSLREQKVLGNVRYIFGRTFWDKLISRALSPQSKYYLIDRVIRKSFYEKQWTSKRGDQIVLITTNRGNLYKGFETLLEAADVLKGLNYNFIWKVVGLNENHSLVEVFSEKYNMVKDRIQLLGTIGEEDLVKELLGADIFIQTSHIENSPNGLAEAMLMGLPVIATFAGGTGSYISQFENGVLVQDGDCWIMAAAIKDLIDKPELASSLGKKARETALERHDPKRIAIAIRNAYYDIAKANSQIL